MNSERKRFLNDNFKAIFLFDYSIKIFDHFDRELARGNGWHREANMKNVHTEK